MQPESLFSELLGLILNCLGHWKIFHFLVCIPSFSSDAKMRPHGLCHSLGQLPGEHLNHAWWHDITSQLLQFLPLAVVLCIAEFAHWCCLSGLHRVCVQAPSVRTHCYFNVYIILWWEKNICVLMFIFVFMWPGSARASLICKSKMPQIRTRWAPPWRHKWKIPHTPSHDGSHSQNAGPLKILCKVILRLGV